MKQYRLNRLFTTASGKCFYVAGVVYGQNSIQHPRPALIMQVLMNLIYKDTPVEACSDALATTATQPH